MISSTTKFTLVHQMFLLIVNVWLAQIFFQWIRLSYVKSAHLHDEVEQLYKLLINNKDEIDRVLESQPVCAIGPSFDRVSFPYITSPVGLQVT